MAATDPNFIDGTTIDFTLDTGAAPDTITAEVAAGTIGPTHLATDSVSADELNATGVEAEIETVVDIPDLQGQVADGQIADGAVDGGSGGEIADASVTADDLGADSVSTSELNGAGVESELEGLLDLDAFQGQITDAQIADGAVDGGTGGEIADDSITAADIATGGVGTAELLDNTVGSADVGAIDSEASGVTITTTTLLEFQAGVSQAAVAGGTCSTPASNAPAPTAVVGSNTIYAVYAFDAATDESAHCRAWLPADFSGAMDLDVMWRAAATSGSVVWAIQTICVADAETGDPAFNTASTITDAAKGTTLQFNNGSATGITATGCAAGEILFLRFFRDADNGSDDMTGDAQLISFRLKMRRAQ